MFNLDINRVWHLFWWMEVAWIQIFTKKETW